MRPDLPLISGAVAIFLIAASFDAAWGQTSQLAPEGRGVLPPPPAATPEGPASPGQFAPDPSGGLSRTVFETKLSPDFNIIIRDFSFPPDRQAHTLTLPSAAFVHVLSGEGDVNIAKRSTALSRLARTPVERNAPIEVVNNGEYPLIVRALIVEAK